CPCEQSETIWRGVFVIAHEVKQSRRGVFVIANVVKQSRHGVFVLANVVKQSRREVFVLANVVKQSSMRGGTGLLPYFRNDGGQEPGLRAFEICR
ncbi:MAG: hypothetical protein LBB84_12285, partial [Tannerellaceae bacterium]|nr:hypothetical protein [Tannerellaceae bacterium]